MTQPQPIDPKDLRQGPIRHESLPPELLEQIGALFDEIGPFLKTTLEQFEIGFMRDVHPDREVAVWANITAAWLNYHQEFVADEAISDEEETKMLAALIAISSGVEDISKLGVSAKVGRRLLKCFEELGKE